MASETGAIYAKILLDESPFTRALNSALNSAKSTLGKISDSAGNTSKALNEVTNSVNGIGKSGNTLGGLNERLTRLNSILDKTQIGSERFKNISAAIEETKGKIDGATQKASNLISVIGTGIAAIGIAGILKSIVGIGSNFSAQMSQVAAASNATKADFNRLSDAARELGATTQFSATQAAEAMTELAKAGLNTNQILLATKDVLALAQAGSISLGESATFVADSMSQFGLAASDTQRIADTLANAANASTISVNDVGESFKYAAGIAKTAGVSIEETATLVAMLGNAGVKASMAGTNIKSMFLMLSAPSKEANKALKSLGISAEYVAANLDKPKVMLQKLNDSMIGASSAKKLDLVSTIFGTEPAAGIIALMDKVETEYDKTLASVSKKGGAAEFGKKATDNLKGDMANLSSAIEEAQLKIYSAIEPVLRFITQAAAVVINGIGDFITKLNSVLVALGPFGDLIKIIAASLAGVAIAIGAVSVALPILSAGMSAVSLASAGMGKAFIAIASQATSAIAAINTQGLTGALKAFILQLNQAAAGAAAKWAMILGPFAAVAAVVYTITYLEKWEKEGQDKANSNRQNRIIGNASGELTGGAQSLMGMDKSIKTIGESYEKLGKQFNTMGGMVQDGSQGMAASIQSIENAAAVASAMGLKKLSKELLDNKNNAKLAKEAIELYSKRTEDLKNNYANAPKTSNNFGGGGLAKAAKEELETVDNFLKRAQELRATSKEPIEFHIGVPTENLKGTQAELKKWAKENKIDIDISGGGKETNLKFKINKDISEEDKARIKEKIDGLQKITDAKGKVEIPTTVKKDTSKSLKDSGTETKKVSFNLDFGNTYSVLKGLDDAMKSFDEAIKSAGNSSQKLALQIGKGLAVAQGLLQSVGGAMMNLMQSQSQLANAKLENSKQKLDFFAGAVNKMNEDNLKNQINAINAETNARKSQFDSQLKALDDQAKAESQILADQKKAELEDEKAFQAEMRALKTSLDEEAKAESDKKFAEAWALRQADYDNQKALIDQGTMDETEKAISQQTLMNQAETEKANLKQQFNDELAAKNETTQQTIEQKQAEHQAMVEKKAADAEAAQTAKEDARNKQKELIESQKTAFLAEQENKRQQAQDAADQTKTENARKVKLMEWSMGKGAFEMNKRMQIAQVQIQMASVVMSAMQAMAGMTAATLGFGFPFGVALAAAITGMGLAAGATSMSAISTAQYPPPPVFAAGGIVPGNSFSGDNVPALVNSGEMILNQGQQQTLFGIANGNKPQGGGTTIYYAGVQIGSIGKFNPDEVYEMVAPKIRQEIYQAVRR